MVSLSGYIQVWLIKTSCLAAAWQDREGSRVVSKKSLSVKDCAETLEADTHKQKHTISHFIGIKKLWTQVLDLRVSFEVFGGPTGNACSAGFDLFSRI